MHGNGDLIVGSTFVTADGAPANHCARWSGSAWSDFGNGLTNVVATL